MRAAGNVVARYLYDPWGVPTVCSPDGSENASADFIGNKNPFRYRGYYYDRETGWYYLNSRYYDPELCRFLNADVIDAPIADLYSLTDKNLFAYCDNNPVMKSDPSGAWPKWLSGVANAISGAFQIATGALLGATVGWTGIGAVAAGFLIANGAATAVQGVGQIVNDVTDSSLMREDNVIRTGFEEIGQAIGGDTGEQVAGILYDTAEIAASLYAGKVGMQNAGVIPVKANINAVFNNPADEFVTIGPANGVITQYCQTIPRYGYGKIYAKSLGNGAYQIVDGHHRVAALKNLGKKNIKIYLMQ